MSSASSKRQGSFEFEDGNAGGMYMQDEVPTVHQIQVGRGALMRVRKSPKKELVGSWIRRVMASQGGGGVT